MKSPKRSPFDIIKIPDAPKQKVIVPWVFKATYFLGSGAAAFLNSFLAVYLSIIGFSPNQIGWIGAGAFASGFVGTVFWSLCGDKTLRFRQLFLISYFCGTSLWVLFGLPESIFPHDFWLMFTVGLAAAFFNSSQLGLLDSITATITEKTTQSYGQQKMWFALGWGLWTFLAGGVIHLLGYPSMFWCYAILEGINILIIQIEFPSRQQIKEKMEEIAEEEDETMASQSSFLSVVMNADYLVFALHLFICACCNSVIDQFFLVYLQDVFNCSAIFLAAQVLTMTISEAVVFYFSDAIIEKFSLQNSFIFSSFCYVFRTWVNTIITENYILFFFPLQLLHGFTYALFWCCVIEFAVRKCPVAYRNTMIGISTGIYMFAGRGVGVLIAGYVYTNFGAFFMWREASIVAFIWTCLYSLYVMCFVKKTRDINHFDENEAEETTPLLAA